jgi:hypothetical protein
MPKKNSKFRKGHYEEEVTEGDRKGTYDNGYPSPDWNNGEEPHNCPDDDNE